jgi:putative oxidoreductase
MLSESQRVCMQTKGVVVGRILMGLLFLVAGIGMFMAKGGPASMVDFYTSVGLPMAGIVVWLVAVLKVVAGGMLIIGRNVGWAAGALAAFTLLATLLAHRDIADPDQLTAALKNLAIIGGLMYVAAFGAGKWNK